MVIWIDRFMISIGFEHLTFSNAGDKSIFDKGITLLKEGFVN